jgi:Ca2+-binding RTX toxin-like protein
LNAGTDTVDASAMTGALNVKFDGDSLLSTDTLTGGTGTGDTLTITAPAAALGTGDFTNVTGFEKIVGADNAAQGITIKDSMTAAAASLDMDFTANTTTAVTASLASETNAGITLTTGGGGDTLTMSASSVGDTISSGAGTDGITVAIAQLSSADTINGGAGTDTVTFSDTGSSADSDFTNVTNIEALTLADGTNSIVLGAEYAESGSVTVTTQGTGADTITLGSGVTTAQTIALTGGADVISAASASGAMTFTITSDLLTAADTITGGTGADTLTITGNSNTISSAEMANVTAIETIKVGSNAAVNISLNDANTVSGVVTVNAALATSAAVTFSAAAEDDGTINFSGGGGIDTVTGAETTATGDTISTGAGADVITGGKGGDTLTGGAGADVFTYTATTHSTGTAKDSITDYTSGTDFLTFTIDNSANTSGQTYDATIQTARAGTSAVQSNMSGSIGQTFFDTTNNVLVVNANADNLVTTLDYQVGLNAASTAANTVAAGDVRFVITGGSGADTIVTGGGADTITGGAGADALDGGAGVDNYKFSDTNGKDTITFVRNSDLLDFSGVTAQGTIAEASITNDAGTTLGATTLTSNTTIYYIDTDATELGTATGTSVTDYTSTTAIATWLNLDDGIVAGGTANDTNYLVINDASDTDAAYVIKHTDDGDGTTTIEAAELEIIAVINSTVAGAVDAADGVIA